MTLTCIGPRGLVIIHSPREYLLHLEAGVNADISYVDTWRASAAQLGLQVDSPLAREIAGVGLIAWSVLWVVVARRLGRSGQLRGDNDLY